MRGIHRDGRQRPTFDTPVIFQRTLATEGDGGQRRGPVAEAYMLAPTADRTAPPIPTQSPPNSQRVAPFNSESWRPYWGTPDAGDPNYKFPTPPPSSVTVPVTPMKSRPYVWFTKAEIKDRSTWELPDIFSFYGLADPKDVKGQEKLEDSISNVAMTRTSLFMARDALSPYMNDAASFAKTFKVRLLGHNRDTFRDIVEVLLTHDRNYIQVICVDRI